MERFQVETIDRDGFTVEISYSYDYERPNAVYGTWTQEDRHIGGVTVALHQARGPVTHWRSCNYTPAELAREYAKDGRDNPSREAYRSLQRELEDDLLGNMITVWCTVSRNGIELASDCIGTACGYRDSAEDCAKECAKEYFDIDAMIADAKDAAHDLAEDLATV